MDSKVSEGGLNVTLTIRLLMHGKVRGSSQSPLHLSSPTHSCTQLSQPREYLSCQWGGWHGAPAPSPSCPSTLSFCWGQCPPGPYLIMGLGWILTTFSNVTSSGFGFFSV